jgi:ABC-type Na+ efflux pump permease subunit
MNTRAMRTIITKDLKVVLKSKAVLFPLIFVPALVLVMMPLQIGVMLANADPDAAFVADFREESALFFASLPGTISERLDGYDNEIQRMTYVIYNLFFPAFYLLMPTMVANVIAADSFAGEKERKTLEALIYTPTRDRELYVAKLFGPWVAGVAVGILTYAAFALVTTLTTFNLMGGAFVFNLTWLLMVLWVTPAASALGLGAMVLVSSRVSTFQEAYQLGGVVVIPLVLMLLGQIAGVVYFSPLVVVGVGCVLWLLALALIGYGARTFQRGALIARL